MIKTTIKNSLVCISFSFLVCAYSSGVQEDSDKLLTAIKTLNVGVDSSDEIIQKLH